MVENEERIWRKFLSKHSGEVHRGVYDPKTEKIKMSSPSETWRKD